MAQIHMEVILPMSFTFLNQLPTPDEIKRDYPLSPELTEFKAKRDAMIADVITGKDDKRFLFIIGPCSADNEDSVCDYVSDLLSYVAIGARSAEDQQHRLTVSGFDVASGMKNPTSGDFSVMLNSVYAAQHSHHFIYRGYEVETTGNPLTHVVLRGAQSKHGNTITNYHFEDLIRLHNMYEKMDLLYPAAVIDTNHSNSGKQFKEQIRIAREVMHNRSVSPEIRSLVKGLMIESYIEEGCQHIGERVYGKSITDPCLGWEDSKQLIYDIAEMNMK